MKGFLDIDGKAYKIASIIADILIITILWLTCSFFIFTAGAATSASYYVMTRRVSDKEGYVLRDFFKSFIQNFIQSTVFTVFIIFCYGILYFNLEHMSAMGDMRLILRPLQIFIAIELTLTSIYIFPVISRFKLGIIGVFKTSVFLANRHLITSITCVALLTGLIFLCFNVYPILIIVAFGIYSFASSHMLMRIFKKYRPEIDSDQNPPAEKPEDDLSVDSSINL